MSQYKKFNFTSSNFFLSLLLFLSMTFDFMSSYFSSSKMSWTLRKKSYFLQYALARDVTSLNKILSSSSMSSMLSSYLGSIFCCLDGKQKQEEKKEIEASMGMRWMESFMKNLRDKSLGISIPCFVTFTLLLLFS